MEGVFGIAGGAKAPVGTGHGDSNYQLSVTDRYVYTNANFTAARTWTLMPARSVPAGTMVVVADLQNTITVARPITIAAFGTDTMTGINVLNGIIGFCSFVSDGISKWQAGPAIVAATAYTVLCGGTTIKGALQSVASVGTAGQPLTSQGAAALPQFEARHAGRLTAGGTTSTAVNIAIKVVLNTSTFATGLTADTTNSRLTAARAARYLVTGLVQMASDCANLQFLIYKNGSLYSQFLTLTANRRAAFGSDIVTLTATDYVELWVQQATGTVLTSVTNTFLAMHEI